MPCARCCLSGDGVGVLRAVSVERDELGVARGGGWGRCFDSAILVVAGRAVI